MSLDFFRIERGLQIDDTTSYLTGNGTPGTSSDTIAVLVGSVYTNFADGSLWTKIASGAGISAWQLMASQTYVNNALGATVSWREPALANDIVSTTVPSGVAGNPIVVDGVSVTDGGRVLFSAITGGAGPNVYIYDQTTGGFVVDTNAQTTGDAVYVQQGSQAGKTFIYNSTAWVQSDQASLDEEGYIRAFVGKPSAGNVLPIYTSTNFIATSDSLRVAVSKVDAELGPNVTVGNWISPSNKVNANITALDNTIGADFGPNNHLTSLTSSSLSDNITLLDSLFGANLIVGSYVSAGQAAFPAIQAIDIALGANVSNGNYILASNKINQNISTLDSAIGPNVSSTGYILATNTVQGNITALNTALIDATNQTDVTNVTTTTLIDSIPAASLNVTKFFVFCQEVATPANTYATELYVLCNGSAVDYTKYATLKLGSAIVGLQISAVLNSGNVSVQVSSTAAVDVKVRRATVIQ